MNYQQYINLRFKRTDLECSVEFERTGYHGFALEKKINKRMFICVTNNELDSPKLYIKKGKSNFCHIIPISLELVFDLVNEKQIEWEK